MKHYRMEKNLIASQNVSFVTSRKFYLFRIELLGSFTRLCGKAVAYGNNPPKIHLKIRGQCQTSQFKTGPPNALLHLGYTNA